MFVHRGYPHGDRDGYLYKGHICICEVGQWRSIAMLSASLHFTCHSTFGENTSILTLRSGCQGRGFLCVLLHMGRMLSIVLQKSDKTKVWP